MVLTDRGLFHENELTKMSKVKTLLIKSEMNVSIVESGYSKEFCYLLGLYLGDGCIRSSEKGNFSLVVADSNIDIVNKAIEQLGLKIKEDEWYERSDRKGKYTIIRYFSVKVTSLIESLCGKTVTKHIPQFIMNDSEENRLYFIAGLLDSDGSIKDIGINFDNKNIYLVDGYCKVLNTFGIFPRIREYQINENTYYTAFILKSSDRLFIKNRVPIQVRHKKNKLNEMEFSNKDRTNIGYTLEEDYINYLHSNIHASDMKEVLRTMKTGQRKQLTSYMLTDLIKLFPQDNILNELIHFVPINIIRRS